ncbi:periostin-like [Ptychodera flava]|uniref:periostin-like n=1 Tax=Ptychodera flava TaxID=63121 RepID=UPI00396A7376
MMKFAVAFTLCACVVMTTGLKLNERLFSAEHSVLQVAEMLGATELIKLVEAAGLNGTLSGKGPFTLFAPTNVAFSHLDPWYLQYYGKNITALQEVLTHHVVSGSVMSSSLSNDKLIPSLQGSKLRANIYMHGQTIATIDGAIVRSVDHKAANGVVHVIEKVLNNPADHDVAWLLQNIPEFSTLLTAVNATNLLSTLAGPGPFTVFAPLDIAFTKLPPGVLDSLVKNPTALKQLLLYHVVSGTYFSPGLPEGPLPTLAGKNVMIRMKPGQIEVEGVMVTEESAVKNGVIYVIENVLFPPQMKFRLDF